MVSSEVTPASGILLQQPVERSVIAANNRSVVTSRCTGNGPGHCRTAGGIHDRLGEARGRRGCHEDSSGEALQHSCTRNGWDDDLRGDTRQIAELQHAICSGFTISRIGCIVSARQKKHLLGMRASAKRERPIYCSEDTCSRSVAISGDRGHARGAALESRFTCHACGSRVFFPRLTRPTTGLSDMPNEGRLSLGLPPPSPIPSLSPARPFRPFGNWQ